MDILNVKYNRLLENPTYFEIAIAISDEYNYATKIAKFLDKKQATVTEQLKLLEENKIIIPEKRGLSQVYSINWQILLGAFKEVTVEIIRRQQKFIGHSIIDLRKFSIENALPHELIRHFLQKYSAELALIGATPKPLSVLVPSMVIAINNLTDIKLKRLSKN